MKPNRRPVDSPTAELQLGDDGQTPPPTYVSFVLRCSLTEDGRIIARLSEVTSGTSCSVSELEELPDLVRRWMEH